MQANYLPLSHSLLSYVVMKKVLLADDKEDIRDILNDFLSEEGYAVDLCSDGEEAFEKAQKNQYDLIITDIMMPVRDGFGFLQALEDMNAEGKAVAPVIVITGGSPSLDFQNSLNELSEKGCVLLKKPFTMGTLMQAVKKAEVA